MAGIAKPIRKETIIGFYYVSYLERHDVYGTYRFFVVQAESVEQVMGLIPPHFEGLLVGGVTVVQIPISPGKPSVTEVDSIYMGEL